MLKMNRTAAMLVILLLAAGANAQTTQPVVRKVRTAPPDMVIDINKQYTATIDTTVGKIAIELFAKEAPKTVNNFVVLSREGFFNGIIFHRVIPGYMIQGGDPTGSGRGDPGYQFENENRDTARTFTKGIVGMANSGLDTNGCQFFIIDADSPFLKPANYTIFGQVKDGQEFVRKIAVAPRDADDRPTKPVTINSIAITEK